MTHLARPYRPPCPECSKRGYHALTCTSAPPRVRRKPRPAKSIDALLWRCQAMRTHAHLAETTLCGSLHREAQRARHLLECHGITEHHDALWVAVHDDSKHERSRHGRGATHCDCGTRKDDASAKQCPECASKAAQGSGAVGKAERLAEQVD